MWAERQVLCLRERVSQWSARPTRIIARRETPSRTPGGYGQPVEERAWQNNRNGQDEIPAEAQLTVFRVANEAGERARPPMRLTLAVLPSSVLPTEAGHSGACPTSVRLLAAREYDRVLGHDSQASSQYSQRLVTQSPSLCGGPSLPMHRPYTPQHHIAMFPEIASAESTDEHGGSKNPTRKKPTHSSISVHRLRASGTASRHDACADLPNP